MISKTLRNAIRLSDLRSYEIAHRAGIHPSTLSKILCGIERADPGDPRVIAIARVLELSPEDCFESQGGVNAQEAQTKITTKGE